jgi:ribonuclease HI
MNFHVYTDGSCKGNPGKGGYAYIVYDDFGEVWINGHGSELESTNNKMEITAAIEALKKIKELYQNYIITLYSDSAYLVNCFNDDWINRWKKNGWKTHRKEDVLNKELWETLYNLVKETHAIFERVSRKDSRIREVDKMAKMATKGL